MLEKLKDMSESSFSGGSNDTNFNSLGLVWAEKSSLEDAETILRGVLAPETAKIVFPALSDSF